MGEDGDILTGMAPLSPKNLTTYFRAWQIPGRVFPGAGRPPPGYQPGDPVETPQGPRHPGG